MNHLGIIIFVLLFIALFALFGVAQEPKEPYMQAVQQAELAMRQGHYDEAIKFYTEAIDLFPKIDAFTPKNKKIKLAEGKFIETPYTGLESFYLRRAKAYLQNGNFESAESDCVNALTVIKYEITKNLEEAKKHRDNVDISKEKKIGLASSHNSDLMRAASSFESALRLAQKAKWIDYERNEYCRNRRIKPTTNEQNILGVEEIIKLQEEAFFGKAEAYTTSMIEVRNRAHNFLALKYADEYVAAFPKSIKAYQLRAKVYRHWGREEAALADEQKARELSGQE